MNKPYIICHMMETLDGRIDCAMTVKINGGDNYYKILNELNVPTTISGRVTAELEFHHEGKFISKTNKSINKEVFIKNQISEEYEIVCDTNGTFKWSDQKEEDKPLLLIMSENVKKDYLSYLDQKSISYIVTGKNKIDLKRAMEILYNEFNIKRVGVVGGGTINAAFLKEGLLDEISILLAPAIDGRHGFNASFDGLDINNEPFKLKLNNLTKFDDDSIHLLYKVIK